MNFLKSLILPTKMRRHKNMTVLLAIAIFALIYYAIYFTVKIRVNNNFEKYKTQNVMGVAPFANIPHDMTISEIKNNSYKVNEDNKLTTTLENDDNFQLYLISYEKDNATYNIYFGFDPHNTIATKLEAMQNDYKEYTGDDTKASMIARLTYIEKLKNPSLDVHTKFDELKVVEDLNTMFNEIYPMNYYNIFPTSNEKTYFAAFQQDYFTYEINPFDEEGNKLSPMDTYAEGYYGALLTIDTSNMDYAYQLGDHITNTIVTAWSQNIMSSTMLYTILTVFLFPLLIVFIMWLFFRRKGNLKTFKQYYNIAAICAIIPAIITVVVTIFYDSGYQVFSFLLSIFYIFTVAKINMTPDDVN